MFGFEAPFQIVRDMIEAVPHAHGYSDSRGIISARRAVVYRYEQDPTFPPFGPDDVYLGNGVSELITMVMQALLDEGDEVLIPAPDYPLWTAMTSLGGGTPVHYLGDEQNGWQPDLEDIRVEGDAAHQGDRHHQPEQPDRRGVLARGPRGNRGDRARELAAACSRTRSTTASSSTTPCTSRWRRSRPICWCLTFNGLSKTYRVAGYRSGWLVITGPKDHAGASSRASPCSPRRGCARTSPRSMRCRRRCRACSRSTR